jgi:oxygen-independent coproporphyrinogen-3 oxidase
MIARPILPVVRKPFAHLYVHIPFCRHKCGYCDFNAYAGMDRLMPEYVDALLRELGWARGAFDWKALRTVYLGGGTPSLLPPPLIERLLGGVGEIFEIAPDAEFTLEANPASTDDERLHAWRANGVNRLSLGVQGFDPRALAVLERKSDGAQAERAFRRARAAGFCNINLDLIFGVPHQDLGSWTNTVQRAIALNPEHLSCYALSFETGTLLTRRRDRGLLPEVASDLQWDQLDVAGQVLSEAGYTRYEVSSWSRTGFESRHNHAYWDCRPVYGAGAGAHSYSTDGTTAQRWWNVPRPREYIAAAPQAREDGETLAAERMEAERLMLGLRTMAGVEHPGDARLDGLIEAGLLERSATRIRPTRRGLDLHNQIALAVL